MRDMEKLWQEQLRDPEFKAYCEEMQASADIADAMIKYRMENNLSQKELAALIGMSQGDVSRLQSYEGNPSLKTLQRIAKGMGKQLRIQFV